MRNLVPRLPRQALLLLGADAASAVGTGMTSPLLMVYLHSVHGLGLGAAGAVLASIGLVSLAGNPLGGWLADRWSARGAIVAGLLVAALGSAGWALMREPWHAFAAAATFGLGVSIAVPAQGALLSTLVAPAQRSSAFAMMHLTMNAGLGAGALLAALVVATPTRGAFVTLYLLDAVSFGMAVLVMAAVRRHRSGAGFSTAGLSDAEPPGAELAGAEPAGAGATGSCVGDAGSGRSGGPGGYGRVLRDPVFRRMWLLAALLFTVVFGQFAALPLLVVESAGLAPQSVSVLFAANTVTVVLCQLVTLRLLAGRRRSRAVRLLCWLWAGCWLLALAACAAGGGPAALALFLAVAVIFAVGETLLAPTVPAIVNDIAPPALRGRYNGGLSLALTTGCVAGPLLAGAALSRGLAVPLLLGLLAASVAAAALMRRTEPHLPPLANLVPPPGAPPAEQRPPGRPPAGRPTEEALVSTHPRGGA